MLRKREGNDGILVTGVYTQRKSFNQIFTFPGVSPHPVPGRSMMILFFLPGQDHQDTAFGASASEKGKREAT